MADTTTFKPAQSRSAANIDMQILCSHIDKPGAVYGLKVAEMCKSSLDKALANGWTDGFMESLSNLIGNAKPAAELNESIVTLVLKSPKGTPGIGYCAVETSQCFSKPITDSELDTANGAPSAHDTSNLKHGRVLPVDRGFAFTAGVTLADKNAALAKKLAQELSVETDPKTKKVTMKNPPITDIKDAEALLELCTTNSVTSASAKIIDASLCGLGGIAYRLLKPRNTTR